MQPLEPEKSPHEQEKIERLRRAMYSRALSERLTERERRELDPTQAQVNEDWKRAEPGSPKIMVAPKHMNAARVVMWWILAAAILFFVSAIGFFIYYFT